MEKLNEATLMKIKEEIGFAGRNLDEDITIIRNWVNQQPHLPTLKDDEETNQWLYNYLFYSKNKMEKVKRHLETYFTCKSLLPEFFADRDPESPEITANVNALYLITLPKLTPEGYRVHIFCHAVQDVKLYEPIDFMRRALMFCDWKMKSDLTSGDIIIFHMKYSSLEHWGRYNLVTLSRFVATLTNAYPLRIKAIHFTQAPSFITHGINNLLATVKLKKRAAVPRVGLVVLIIGCLGGMKASFLRELNIIPACRADAKALACRMQKATLPGSLRILRAHELHFHSTGNVSKLLKEIPEDCLPKELGGSLEKTMEELNDMSHKNLLEMKEWFRANENAKSDESKRSEPLKENNLFGCDGTFRSLSID